MSVIGCIVQRGENILHTPEHKWVLNSLLDLFRKYAFITASAEGALAFFWWCLAPP